MPTVDLSTPPPPPPTLLAGLPRRLTLTLPELRLAAERAGGAPLPFDTADAPVSPSGTGSGLESRLGPGRDDTGAAAYAATVEGLHDPEDSLTRRGLVGQGGTGGLEPGLAGAVGLLGTPRVVVDLDVNVGGAHVHAWHREGRGAVATLATADGVVFELGWCGTRSWPGELARAAALPAGLPVSDSALPAVLDLPYELLDTAGEAFRGGRGDVVAVLAHRHGGEVVADGTPVPEAAVPGLLGALGTETRGRLRALVAELPDGSAGAPAVAGVASWLLLADGWHALRPHTDAGVARVEVRRVVPDDLAGSLAPVLAEVTR